MKSIFSITFLFHTLFSFGQCINLYVKEHYSGDPICRLVAGDELEICFKEKTVRGGACSFYIMRVSDTYSGMSIDLALDNVYYAQKYAELMINTQTQNFGFQIGYNTGAYSYYSETEMKQKRALEEARRTEEQRIKQEEDKTTKMIVESYLNNNNLDAAITEFNKMHYVDNTLESRIDSEIKKRNLEEDSKRIESIESMLSSNQVDLSVEEFKKLHYNNDNIKQKVQNAIIQNYEKQTLVLQPDILNKIISENKKSFTNIYDGQYKMVLTKDGSVSAQSLESSTKIEICSNKSYLKKDGFEFPATYSGDLTISTDKIKMNAGDSIWYIIPKKHKRKDIYISLLSDKNTNKGKLGSTSK
jgi:hypothetical protein